MSTIASEKFGSEVLLVFIGHSSDADACADAIYDLERELQRLLDQHLSVTTALPFKTVRMWEWRKDGLPLVGGQDQIVAAALQRANVAVFVFKERIGSVSWDELIQSRNRENSAIPVLAFFPSDSPADLNDEDRAVKWAELVKKRGELVKDWTAPDSKALRPMDKYKDLAHLKMLTVDHLKNAIVSLLKCEPIAKPIVVDITPGTFLGNHEHLSYDQQPVLTRTLDELDRDLIKELLAKPLSQDLNAYLERGRDGSGPVVSEQLKNLGCLYAGHPTLGALLCFAPPEHLGDKSGCCTLQMAIHDTPERGGERAPIALARGNLLLLYKKGMAWLAGGSVLRRRGKIGSAQRDELEIPEIVLREALTNALIHRDYESKILQDQPTRIDVYPDKVEITSYGLLLKEVPLELLNSPDQGLRPFRRNPVIATVFQCMTLAELNASGVQRMRRVMVEAELPLPLFRSSENFVCVTLARPFELSSAREIIQLPPNIPLTKQTAFISSTSVDLAEHRKAAQDACLRAGIFPVLWETLPARDLDATTALQRMVDEADIYICIIGQRYGSVFNKSGISFTEMEFDRAAERKLPILVFTMHKDHPITLDAVSADSDSQEKLERFKEKACKDRLWIEFKSPEDLRGRMIEALAALPIQERGKRRFRVAFSFAGEKRDFAAKVAALLAQHFGESAILYDKYHEAEFARSNLSFYLPKLYVEESELVVVVASRGYEKKEWCGLEWEAVHRLLTNSANVDIMLTRFDQVTFAGLPQTAGFIDLDDKTPEQATTLILERLALNEGKPKDSYTTNPTYANRSVKTAIPNNLPRLPYFFGREVELKKIADALAPEARGWGVLIDGPGGIGKTALAIRAAELVPNDRFLHIIFLSSKERELTADGQREIGYFVLPTYLEILNAIASELGQPDLKKSPDQERSTLVLRALREKEVLLVLDNLETLLEHDRAHLFAFLNRLPRGSRAIVTSRRRADAGAVSVRLDRLDWDASYALLAELGRNFPRLSQASEADRRALYEQTGGNPLLIRWVSGQLGRGRCHTVTAALDLLRSTPLDNNPLEFIFSHLLDTVTSSEEKILAALAHFTEAVEVKVVAELSGISEAAAQTTLEDLATRALVLSDTEACRFTLVPMVADFLRHKRPDVIVETGNRLEQRAYALIVENGYNKHERFSVLDTAWPTVAPALPLFLAGPNDRLQSVCHALFDFLNFTGRWDECLYLNQKGESKAVAVGDHNNAGWRAHRASWIHYLRHEVDSMLRCADSALVHWQTVRAGTREQAFAIGLRGVGHILKKDYPAAIATFQEALELFRALSAESVDVVNTLNDGAGAKQLSGDLDAAERDYREALRIAHVLRHTESVAFITCNLADLALDRKDWLKAETLAREALTLSENVGRQELIAEGHLHLAKALIRQEKPVEAMPYAQRSVEILTRLGSPKLEEARAILAECESGTSR